MGWREFIKHAIKENKQKKDCYLHIHNHPGSHIVIFDSNPSNEVITFASELALFLGKVDNPEDYWTEEEVSDLKKRLTEMMTQIIDNKCTDCNK